MSPLSTTWRKSTFSGDAGCVEVALLPHHSGVAVRDTKNRNGAELRFSVTEWSAFLAGVNQGEFDL